MRSALFAAALTVAALLVLATRTSLWDRDEPRFAQSAVEMLRSGDYLVPSFNGEVRAQKPPLVYWLMTVSLRLFESRELAVRFWSPVAVGVTALITFVIGRKRWSAVVGRRAMLILALNPMVWVQGTAATTDALLLASITASIAILTSLVQGDARARDVCALALTLGAGLLIKGPVALVLPVAVAATLTLWLRAPWRHLARPVTLATAGAIAAYLAWLIPAAYETGGEIARRGLLYENVARTLRPFEGHGTPLLFAPFYYPIVCAIAFLPWTDRLLHWLRGWRAECEPVRTRLLASWTVVPIAAFTLAATKLPHYVLPVWPALSLMAAASFTDSDAHARAFRRRATAALLVGLAVAVAAPVIDRLKPVPPIAAAIAARGAGVPLFTYGFEEPSLVFYSGARMIPLTAATLAGAWRSSPPGAVLVASRTAIEEWQRENLATLALAEIAAVQGWNVANGRRIELVAFVRSE